MKLRLPQSRIRRPDVLVASLDWLWLTGWAIEDYLNRWAAMVPAHAVSGLLALLIGTWTVETLILLGVAFGDRRAFGVLAALSLLGSVGSFTTPLMAHRPITTMHAVNALVEMGLFVYCSARLRQGRASTEPVPVERAATVRFADAFVSTLNAVWAAWFMVTVLSSQIPAHRLRGSTDYRAEVCIEFVGLIYLVICGGMALGRRWAFIAITIGLGFFTLGEVGLILSAYPASGWLTLLALLHGTTVAYACFRLLRARPPLSVEP